MERPEVRHLTENELPLLKQFSAREYNPRHIFANSQYLNWQFGSFRKREDGQLTILGVFGKSGRLRGIFGYVPVPCWCVGEERIMASCCHLMVAKESRHLGYGYFLVEHMRSLCDGAFIYAVNDAARPLFKDTEWTFDDLNRFVFILNADKVRKLAGNRGKDIKTSAALETSRQEGFRLSFITHADGSLDELWESAKSRYPIATMRSSTYLNWRYTSHPFFRYKQLTLKRDNKTVAYAVVRFDEPEQYRIAHIVDLYAIDEESIEAMLLSIIGYCRENMCDMIDYAFSGSYHRESLKRAGFVNAHEGPYVYIPRLFNPIEWRPELKVNFAVYRGSPEIPRDVFCDTSNWYTVKGDGERDRPAVRS